MPSDHQKSTLLLQRINTSTPSSNTAFCQPIPSSIATSFDPPTTLPYATEVPDSVTRYHTYSVGPNQCCSSVVQEISASTETVWSIVRRFDNPQAYKHFIKSCNVIYGDCNVGAVRQVDVVSGLPAVNSIERLDMLDDERHVISFSVIGGEHRLSNYRSVTALDRSADGVGTVVRESYVVDIPAGNTWDETCIFVSTIVKCNLKSLKRLAEDSAGRNTSVS